MCKTAAGEADHEFKIPRILLLSSLACENIHAFFMLEVRRMPAHFTGDALPPWCRWCLSLAGGRGPAYAGPFRDSDRLLGQDPRDQDPGRMSDESQADALVIDAGIT